MGVCAGVCVGEREWGVSMYRYVRAECMYFCPPLFLYSLYDRSFHANRLPFLSDTMQFNFKYGRVNSGLRIVLLKGLCVVYITRNSSVNFTLIRLM